MYGDLYGNTIEEAIAKYYTYEIDGLKLYNVTGHEDIFRHGDDVFEYMLAQENIDTSWMANTNNLYMGIGCACIFDDKMTCMVGIAKDIRQKYATERLPFYQDFSDDCYEYCYAGQNDGDYYDYRIDSLFYAQYIGDTDACPHDKFMVHRYDGYTIRDNDKACYACNERWQQAHRCGCNVTDNLFLCQGTQEPFIGHVYPAASYQS